MRHRRPGHDARPERGRTAAGLSADRLAGWAAAGLVDGVKSDAPDGPELALHDATLVRSLCRADPDRPTDDDDAGRLRATLGRVRALLPTAADPPAAVTLVDAGPDAPLLLRLDDGTLADPSGQFRLAFTTDDGRRRTLGRIGPATADDWHARGVDLELAGDRPAAADAYGRALLLAGPHPQWAFDLAHVLADLGEHAAAVERYRQVVELDPRRADAWLNLGDLLVTAGRHDEAVAAFRHALDLDPDDPAAHYDLADAFDRAGQPARAAPHYDAFLRLADGPPEHLAYAAARARLASAAGSVPVAQHWASRADPASC